MRVALEGRSRYSIRQLAAPSAPGGRGSHATAPGCGVVGEIDLRRIDCHPGASIESLIPQLSCQRCSPERE